MHGVRVLLVLVRKFVCVSTNSTMSWAVLLSILLNLSRTPQLCTLSLCFISSFPHKGPESAQKSTQKNKLTQMYFI